MPCEHATVMSMHSAATLIQNSYRTGCLQFALSDLIKDFHAYCDENRCAFVDGQIFKRIAVHDSNHVYQRTSNYMPSIHNFTARKPTSSQMAVTHLHEIAKASPRLLQHLPPRCVMTVIYRPDDQCGITEDGMLVFGHHDAVLTSVVVYHMALLVGDVLIFHSQDDAHSCCHLMQMPQHTLERLSRCSLVTYMPCSPLARKNNIDSTAARYRNVIRSSEALHELLIWLASRETEGMHIRLSFSDGLFNIEQHVCDECSAPPKAVSNFLCDPINAFKSKYCSARLSVCADLTRSEVNLIRKGCFLLQLMALFIDWTRQL